MLKTSVVLTTFNGEKYIIEQLESIKSQSQAVNEVIILDDCSLDNTYDIVYNYINSNKLHNWHLIENDINKGWKENFLHGFKKITGDIIFYCDQDDIWLNDKVNIMTSIMEMNNDCLCLSSRYQSIDKDGNVINFSADRKSTGTKKIKRINVYDKRFFCVPSGCTIAFKKELLSYIDLNDSSCGPDRVLCRTAMLLDRMYDYDEVLIKHRFHNSNASNKINDVRNLSGSSTLKKRIEYVSQDVKQLENFYHICYKLSNEKQRKLYRNVCKFEKARVEFFSNKLLALPKAVLYVRCCYMLILLLGDIAYYIHINKKMGRLFVYFLSFIKRSDN